MKTMLLLLFFIGSIQKTKALTIADISLSAISDDTINVSINTEAVELYYFNSWQYSVSGNTIILEACFIPGFGSTIAYLNNNFPIAIDVSQPATYHLLLKVYYNTYEDDCLQDSCEGVFSTPLPVRFLTSDIVFANPTDGKLWVNHEITEVFIFDATGRMIGKRNNNKGTVLLYDFADGLYFISYIKNSRYKTLRVILRKQ